MENTNLANLLKYCLGYIKLVNPAFSRSKLTTGKIKENFLDTDFIYNIQDIDGELDVPVNLKEFYELTPKNLDKEVESVYLEQKTFASKIEEIKDKFKIDEFTKQINLNFGFFELELNEEDIQTVEEDGKVASVKKVKGKFPLFSLPINIHQVAGKYYLDILEPNIIPNVGFLQNVLGEERFYEFLDYISQLEISDSFKLPIDHSIFNNIWKQLKAKLRLSEAIFDEESFDIKHFEITLVTKSNYFLAQDIKKLVDKAEANDEDLLDSSLGSWVADDELNISNKVDEGSGEIFFPFDYNKHQLNVLSIVDNKAAIVEGPPGTGKSQTIANILCHLAAKNKKVLFLSQKAQALKVVKDSLKKLDVDYLYGYIPNRASNVYNDEEEKDGASNALGGIQSYLASLSYKRDNKPNQLLAKGIFENFNYSIEIQRSYFYLQEKLANLKKYNLDVKNSSKYCESFSASDYDEIQKIKKEIQEIKEKCGNIIAQNKSFNYYNENFRHIPIEDNTYSENIKKLLDYIKNRIYDRKTFITSIRKSFFKMSVRDITNPLPREILDLINKSLDKDISKHQMVAEISPLADYCEYKEYCKKDKELNEKLELKIVSVGLTKKSLEILEELSNFEEVNDVIDETKQYQQISNQIKEIRLSNPNEIGKLFSTVKKDRKERIRFYLKNIIKNQILSATGTATIKGILARIAKALTKSKKAYRTFDNLKNDSTNFLTLKEIIPIWIMDLEDVGRLVPLEKNIFDYIILDEASQCNLAYAIPAMYRSKHVIFFGDSEQMRDDSIRFKTNRSLEELARKYEISEHLQIRSKADTVKSVMDIGIMRGFQTRTLLYHYRSPKEIIGFSNKYFYEPKRKRLEVINSNYLTYKDTNRVMINHLIKPEKERDISEKTNIAEAEYIAKLIKDLQSDKNTKDKTIGVLTFFNEQAFLLRQVIDDESIKVAIIEGIQGDERDIIIYSFVISSPDQKNRYIAMAGEGGLINKDLNAGRVNVAFSRAKLQVHCVTSMPIDNWPEGIWIKKYLKYAEENGEINFYDIKLNKFDSYFEEEFYYFMRNKLDKRYIIQNQIESCGFRLDFVITDSKNGRKIAVECDGPTHFEEESPEIYVESDLERQNILESAGWNFYRVLYSDWLDEKFDRNILVSDIIDYFEKPEMYLERYKIKEPERIPSLIAKNNLETQEIQQSEEEETEKRDTDNSILHSDLNELARIEVDTRRDVVASFIKEKETLLINEYLKNGSYIGFTKAGVAMSFSDIPLFIRNCTETIKTGNPTSVPWNKSMRSKVVIQRVGTDSLDLRQFIETDKYTGFTRKGLRVEKKIVEKIIFQLRDKLKANNQ